MLVSGKKYDVLIQASDESEWNRVFKVCSSSIFRDLCDSNADLSHREEVRRALGLDALPPICSVEVIFSRPLLEMIKDGNYDSVDSAISEVLFPVKGSGHQTFLCELFHPQSTWTLSKDIVAQMQKSNFRPAGIEQLLSFGAVYPFAQLRYRIVALGSISQGQFLPQVPLIGRNRYREGIERGLYLESASGDDSRGNGWLYNNSFLGVRETSTL